MSVAAVITGNNEAPVHDPAVKFIFLFSPNNSGTTVMSQYLAQQIDAYLPPFGNCEGQMAPAVAEMMRVRPWDRSTEYDWPFIRRAWEALCVEAGKTTFLEGSPPNIMRVPTIVEAFKDCASFVASISSPYFQISSRIYNYETAPLTNRMLLKSASGWLKKAEALKYGLECCPNVPVISYSEFCQSPEVIMGALGLRARERAPLQGKGNTRLRDITDLTPKNLAFFDVHELDLISETLAEHQEVLDFFKIELASGINLLNEAYKQPALAHSGVLRRLEWNTTGKKGRAAHQTRLKARKAKSGAKRPKAKRD